MFNKHVEHGSKMKQVVNVDPVIDPVDFYWWWESTAEGIWVNFCERAPYCFRLILQEYRR